MRNNSIGSGTGLSHKDICLIANRSIVESRSLCDTSIQFLGKRYKLPICPANMSCVIEDQFEGEHLVPLARELSFGGYFYIYHRFNGRTYEFVKHANQWEYPLISISVGINEADKELLKRIFSENLKIDVITIDIAHGFSEFLPPMVEFIRGIFGNSVKIIAGNFWGDEHSMFFAHNLDIDAVKIGLSFGAGCSTFAQTGFASPMFTAAMECGKWTFKDVIIDGGIKGNGDIIKAIRGFNEHNKRIPMVMAGSLFAACMDAPGESVWDKLHEDGVKLTHKKYFGSASSNQKGQNKHVEGKEILLECNRMMYRDKLTEIKESIQSAISYAGGKDLDAIKNVNWLIIK